MDLNEELQEQELIESIAKPILDLLFSMQDPTEKSFSHSKIQVVQYSNLPDVPDGMDRIVNEDITELPGDDLPPEFVKKLEAYLQEQLDEWLSPAVLH